VNLEFLITMGAEWAWTNGLHSNPPSNDAERLLRLVAGGGVPFAG
jgi:hypothetical protein